jgi:hypothetical protein
MSGDLTYLFNDGTYVVGIAIMLVGFYRAQEMRRAFVDPTYKSRALWSMLLMAVIILSDATVIIPTPNTALGTVVGFTPFLAVILVSFAFIDRTVLVAAGTDFFHRSILRWAQLRLPLAIALMASGAVGFMIGLIYPAPYGGFATGEPLWAVAAVVEFTFGTVAVLTLGAVAAVIGARRTSDQTLKRNIRILAYALLCFVMTIVTGTVILGDVGAIVSNMLGLLATYLLYLSMMSLSPLGRVETDVNATSKPNDGRFVQPPHP